MAFILQSYKSILQKYPVAVQAFQAGVLMGTGDVIAQTAVEKSSLKNVDWNRTFRFASVGFVVIGPPLRIWYGFLQNTIRGSSQTVALKKTAADQLFFAPMFLACVMGSISLSQGDSFDDTKKRLLRDYKDVLLTNYKIWPAVQLCNFYVVPLQYQVLTVQVVAVFWNTYLSWKTNKALER